MRSMRIILAGVAVLVAMSLTVWVVVVPTRAPQVIAAVEAAAYAELYRDSLPAEAVEILERSWREAISGRISG